MVAGFKFDTKPSPEVAGFLDKKGLKPSFHWADVSPREHAFGFTVAKATRLDVLTTLFDEVKRAQRNGIPFDAWAKDLEPRLEKLGWWGKQDMLDPKTGKMIKAQLGSPRRLKTIYWANTRSARAAGLWERAQRTKAALPYFVYSLGPSQRHRPDHQAQSGITLPVDDPFWDVWFTPNGWRCKCWVRQISKTEADRNGGVSDPPEIEMKEWTNPRTGETIKIPEGIDPGWQGNPGKNRARTQIDNLNLKMENAGKHSSALPKQVINELWRSKAPHSYSKMNERVHLPVAYVPGLASKLDAKTPLVAVSSDTIAVKVGKHKTIEANKFEQVQRVLEEGTPIDRGPQKGLSFWLELDGSMHAVALKKSGDGYLYIATFFQASGKRFDALKAKHGIWGE
ncbi:phage minor head protein [Pseudovibrio sp. Tun.PSC04-5.I4]|uniref:phage head morphogenesis protein n=1 Tax=Pseudovibrio sp. Tun.PSC04-5.I4 TaxID=1798213 RepID=UPI00087FCE42|nr:phage minor head protein [Pseudovibrio sp. Tun.PSC04-5.I4]SDR07768.1 Phage Mu protein F like protein [Pseudovibrio sp. Tun.PSC04-5.I4]